MDLTEVIAVTISNPPRGRRRNVCISGGDYAYSNEVKDVVLKTPNRGGELLKYMEVYLEGLDKGLKGGHIVAKIGLPGMIPTECSN